jgi:hypothetical protein
MGQGNGSPTRALRGIECLDRVDLGKSVPNRRGICLLSGRPTLPTSPRKSPSCQPCPSVGTRASSMTGGAPTYVPHMTSAGAFLAGPPPPPPISLESAWLLLSPSLLSSPSSPRLKKLRKSIAIESRKPPFERRQNGEENREKARRAKGERRLPAR